MTPTTIPASTNLLKGYGDKAHTYPGLYITLTALKVINPRSTYERSETKMKSFFKLITPSYKNSGITSIILKISLIFILVILLLVLAISITSVLFFGLFSSLGLEIKHSVPLALSSAFLYLWLKYKYT